MLKRISGKPRLKTRAAGHASPELEGLAFSFAETTADGAYGRERFAPDCKIDYPKRVFLLRDHDRSKILARRGKNLEIEKTGEGLAFSCARLPNTSLAVETRELIKEGILTDVSVGFIDRDSDIKDGVREYKHIELHEISLLGSGYFESGQVSARQKEPEKEPLPPELLT